MSKKQIDLSSSLQIAKIKMAPDANEVEIVIRQRVILAPSTGETESREKYVEWPAKTDFAPHDDLKAAMTNLRKFALDIIEMPTDEKTRTAFDVICVDISGDMDLQTSRVKLCLGKYVKRTGKTVKINDVPQVAMYNTEDYADADKMTKAIENLIAECWLYLNGKNGEQFMFTLFFTQLEARGRDAKVLK